MSYIRPAAIGLVLAFAIAGCGQQKLSRNEADAVALASVDLSLYCLDGKHPVRADAAVDRLVELFRAKPDARTQGASMRQLLADEASDLESCAPQLSRRLDRARQAGP